MSFSVALSDGLPGRFWADGRWAVLVDLGTYPIERVARRDFGGVDSNLTWDELLRRDLDTTG